MKNQIFDTERFSAYFKKYVAERRTPLLSYLGVLFLFPIAVCLLIPLLKGLYDPIAVEHFIERGNILDPMWGSELTLFVFLWLLVCLKCGDFYSMLTGKRERISLFTCPASNFEKFSTYFLISVILFPIIFFGIFLFVDAIRVWVFRAATGAECIHYISPLYLLSFGTAEKFWDIDFYSAAQSAELMDFFRNTMAARFSMALLGGLLIQALYALGCTVWPKRSFLKTSCFSLAFLITAGILFYEGSRLFYGNDSLSPREFGFSSPISELIFYDLIAVCIIIFTWIISYMRFKEWEVIKRW